MQRNELVNWANSLGFDASTIPNDSKLEAHLKYLQNNGTAISGTLATGALTSDGTAQSDGDEVTIGDITYTFKTALSETKASTTLTVTGNFSEGETVSIEGQTYTFRAVPSNPYDVDIGSTAAESLDFLKQAINQGDTVGAGEGEGTNYGTDTVYHPLVTATTNGATTQVVEAKRLGTYANGYLTSETCASASWEGATIGDGTPGVDPVPFEFLIGASAAASLDNLKSTINDSGTEGTTYSTGTYAHPKVTATTNTDTTQTIQARDYSVTNGSIATTDPTDTGNHMAWGAGTLASGTADQNAVNAAAVAQTGSGTNANV